MSDYCGMTNYVFERVAILAALFAMNSMGAIAIARLFAKKV